jgi:hypothetical protein
LAVESSCTLGAMWLLDGLWQRLGVAEALRAEWASHDAAIPRLAGMDDDQADRAMDLLIEGPTRGAGPRFSVGFSSSPTDERSGSWASCATW